MPLTIKPVHVPKINLIPKDPFYETLIGKVMLWAIQVGRYIIVFTEVIVIMSFATRFKLDRDLTDLTAKVTQKRAIVGSFGDVETRTRAIQDQIATVKKLLGDNTASRSIDTLSTHVPSGVELSQLTYEPGVIILAGKASSSNLLASMLLSLQQEKGFKTVAVDKISSGEGNDPTVAFSIKVGLPENKNRIAPETPSPAPGQAAPPDVPAQ
jgi:Tfp pilus assembly protein PilN